MNNKNIIFCNFFINNKSKISSKSLVTIQRLFFLKTISRNFVLHTRNSYKHTHTHTKKK